MAEGWRLKLLRVAVSPPVFTAVGIAICVPLVLAFRYVGIEWFFGVVAVVVSFFLGWGAAYRFWRKNGYVKNI